MSVQECASKKDNDSILHADKSVQTCNGGGSYIANAWFGGSAAGLCCLLQPAYSSCLAHVTKK